MYQSNLNFSVCFKYVNIYENKRKAFHFSRLSNWYDKGNLKFWKLENLRS